MPRISSTFLESAFYLYPSVEAAKQGERSGGTGFLVGLPYKEGDSVHSYAVTNKHIVREFGSPVIRFNTKEGEADPFPLTKDDWIPHTGGDDLAVFVLSQTNMAKYQYKYVPPEGFVTKEVIDDFDIGEGEDTFTVGRFISHDGGTINKPSVRFGNISMMPTVINFQGHDQECYLVENRSLRGSSGSPVFMHIVNTLHRRRLVDPNAEDPKINTWLLGIAFADVPYEEEVKNKVIDEHGEMLADTSYIALSNSGQMAVIPAWRLLDFLTTDVRFVMQREEDEKREAKRRAESPLRPTVKG